MTSRRITLERIVAVIVTSVYVFACCSDVIRAGLSAGPFDYGPINGFDCVLTGWMHYPFAWLANQLLWLGIILLANGHSRPAAMCGLFALGPVVQWSVSWHHQGLWPMLQRGYYLWVASVVLLVVGSLIVYFVRAHGFGRRLTSERARLKEPRTE